MERSVCVPVILFLLMVVDFSDASYLWNIRKLIRVTPNDNSTTQNSPLPTPVSGGKDSIMTQDDPGKTRKDKAKDSQAAITSSSNVDPKNSIGKAKNMDSVGSHTNKHTVNTGDSTSGISENCSMAAKKCNDQKDMIACIHRFSRDSSKVYILIKNQGESTLMVNLTMEASQKKALPFAEIPKHHSKMVNTLLTNTSIKIVLNAGNGDCVLLLKNSLPFERTLIHRLSYYSRKVTSTYGVHFLLLVTLIIVITWVCCKLMKRKQQDGVPYQELEIEMPASAANMDTVEVWDQVWDDDWDEENAVKSPGRRHASGISANGLTSRSSKKDGWEKDWDD